MIGDLLYQFGYTLGGLGSDAGGKAGAAVYDPELGEAVDLDEDPALETGSAAAGAAGTAALGTLGTLLLARMLTPKPIRWPRAILAGVAATALADLIGRTFDDEPAPGRLPYAADPAELMTRFSAGIALTAGYAALLYPRLPGSPLFRGLLFGGLEIAAAPRGGLTQIAAEIPGLRFPLQALALPVDEDAGPLSHLAFGLGLGLFYRDARARRGEDEEEYEEYEEYEDEE